MDKDVSPQAMHLLLLLIPTIVLIDLHPPSFLILQFIVHLMPPSFAVLSLGLDNHAFLYWLI